MEQAAIESIVKNMVVKHLGVKETDVALNKSFIADLGADSLDIVELVMALEDEFKLEIPDEEADSIRTVKDAVNYIMAHRQ